MAENRSLYSQKISTIDGWLGSEYTSIFYVNFHWVIHQFIKIYQEGLL